MLIGMKMIEKIRRNALSLSVVERASLAHDLIVSLDDPSNYELSPQQEAEIKRRVRCVKEGKASGRAADQVFADIEAKRP